MEGVVERGTARAAQIPGYTIAGKTGTAAKLVNGHYSHSEYNASFVGFLPSRDPAVTIIVVIDSPHGAGYTGGVVSAPVFKRIAESTLRYLGIGPTINPAPAVLVARDADDIERADVGAAAGEPVVEPHRERGAGDDSRPARLERAAGRAHARQAGAHRPPVGRRRRRHAGAGRRHAARIGRRLPARARAHAAPPESSPQP